MSALTDRLLGLVEDVPDFPRPGIGFKDVSPLLADPQAFAAAVEAMAAPHLEQRIDRVVGIEARGFVLAAPVAYRLGAGFVPVRKPGKLPKDVHETAYELEYGSNVLQVHRDGLRPGDRVLVVDDVLATGGTAAAAARLVAACGAELVGFGLLLELSFLDGRAALARDLPGTPVTSLLSV